MSRNPRYYSEENVFTLIHDGAAKCRREIVLADTDDQIEGVIGMCNCLSKSVVAILNNEDYRVLGRHFNIHRPWCKRAFRLLQDVITELDARITIRKNEIEGNPSDGSVKIGFTS